VSGLRNIRFLHDNARPHVHSNVRNYLQEKGIKLIDHPPYSPDSALSDFWLFDEIKRRLPVQITEENLYGRVTQILESIPRQEYFKPLYAISIECDCALQLRGTILNILLNK